MSTEPPPVCRIAGRRPARRDAPWTFERPADQRSAIQQTSGLRYFPFWILLFHRPLVSFRHDFPATGRSNVASGILPDVEPGLPARRMGVDKATALWNSNALYPGGRMRALYGGRRPAATARATTFLCDFRRFLALSHPIV